MQRSRRRSSRDVELTLGHAFPKDDTVARNHGSRVPDVITIDDDDNDDDDYVDDEDDLLVYSPSPVSASEGMPLFPITNSWVPVVTEEDLELRLGFKAYDRNKKRNCSGKADSKRKGKFGVASSSKQHHAAEMDVKLRCTICMDTMKEETSTLCGHLFCKPCITSALRMQNKCPTCRKELSVGNIHRIYLPGATS